jgi:hypothetical protein
MSFIGKIRAGLGAVGLLKAPMPGVQRRRKGEEEAMVVCSTKHSNTRMAAGL